jgi:hypothetical protein
MLTVPAGQGKCKLLYTYAYGLAQIFLFSTSILNILLMNIKTHLSNCFIVLLLLLLTSSCENRQKSASNKQFSADVIIYGGNSSALIAAVQLLHQ